VSKAVLVLAYHFPPVGGAGVQRPARLVRYVREFGYRPIVVTGPGDADGRWTPRDESLVAEIPADVEVRRVSGPEPPQDGRGDRIARWTGTASPWARWWIRGAVAAGAGADVDLVYAWMQPYPTAVAGARLAARLGRPWVADLGDPWALDEMIVWPSRLHRRWEERRMLAALRSAAAIVMSTPEAARRVRERFPELAGKRVLSIPNGFAATDFEGHPPQRNDNAFRIVHTGYLHTNLGRRYSRFSLVRKVLGGQDVDVDVLTRSHVYLLEALGLVARRRPDISRRIELHLAGVLSPEDLAVAERSTAVRTHGYLTHPEAVALMQSADLLFLPMHDLPPGRRATIVPGKTYEYLAAGPPILAAVPDGDARDLLVEAGNASIARPADVEVLAAAIIERADAAGAAAPQRPPHALLRRYEYRELAGELAATFDAVTPPTSTGGA
jgi:glycosyltransferase involved in cell wall biosynthesis